MLLLASLLAVVLAVLAIWLPGCTLLETVPEEEARALALDQIRQTMQPWTAAKIQVIDELQARRLTLPQAVARFRAINDQVPYYPWHFIERQDPSRTAEENVARWVIGWIRLTLQERGQDTALADRLEAELQCRVACGTLSP
jgi:hypothetical protein